MGRKPLLIISLLGTVVANLLVSFTPFAWLLFAARILDGLTGGNTSIATAVISDTTAPEERPKAFGLFDAAFRKVRHGPAISYFAQSLPTFPGVSSLGMSFAGAYRSCRSWSYLVATARNTTGRGTPAELADVRF